MTDHRILIVEGANDVQFIKQLTAKHGIRDDVFKIRECGSDTQAIGVFETTLKINNDAKIGLILDADANAKKRWGQLAGRLKSLGYKNLPKNIPAIGWTHSQPNLSDVGLWLMPDNQTDGKLENLAELMIQQGDLLWPHARKVVKDLPERRFKAQHAIKSEIHTWLAWQDNPGTSLGAGVMYGYFQPNSPQAVVFINWLRRLFA